MADTPDAQLPATTPPRPRKTPVVHVPTPATQAQVRVLVAAGTPPEDIARLLNISRRSFFRHYKRDTEVALVQQVSILNARLLTLAGGNSRGAVRAAIYMAEKAEARLRRHHGLDRSDERSYEQDVAATRPTILRPDEPGPTNPVL